MVRTGVDPIDSERDARRVSDADEEDREHFDFGAFADRFIEKHVKANALRSLKDIEGTFDRDLRPWFKGKSVRRITKADVKAMSVHIVLEWLGEEYRGIKVNPGDPEYRKLNPAGQVPMLETDGGELLTQCSVILGYLSHTHPDAGLSGDSSPLGQARLGKWSAFFTGDVHPAFFPVFMPQRYTTATDDEALGHVREAGTALVRKRRDLLEEHMRDRQLIVGDTRTYVDAYSVPMIRWASSMLPNGLADWPAVKARHKRMLADPGVERAMRDEGLIGG